MKQTPTPVSWYCMFSGRNKYFSEDYREPRLPHEAQTLKYFISSTIEPSLWAQVQYPPLSLPKQGHRSCVPCISDIPHIPSDKPGAEVKPSFFRLLTHKPPVASKQETAMALSALQYVGHTLTCSLSHMYHRVYIVQKTRKSYGTM